MISNRRIIIVLFLFAVSHFTVKYFKEVKAVPIKQSLAQFPSTLGDWKVARKRVLAQRVKENLGVEEYIDYTFTNKLGDRLNLYVSYFSRLGVDGEYHSPQNCMPGGGWQIISLEKVPIEYRNGRTAEINKMIVNNGGQKQLVFYWFQSRGRIIASEYWDRFYTVLDAVVMRRRDGAFIRVLSPDNDYQKAKQFSQKVAQTLTGYLPGR